MGPEVVKNIHFLPLPLKRKGKEEEPGKWYTWTISYAESGTLFKYLYTLTKNKKGYIDRFFTEEDFIKRTVTPSISFSFVSVSPAAITWTSIPSLARLREYSYMATLPIPGYRENPMWHTFIERVK
jgi:hypothetical protein